MTQFLDLSRAFDCVSHEFLLQKLEHIYRFDKLSLKLTKSYLSERQQKVMVGDRMSGSKVIDRGVPQGSIMGPLLFLMFFNDFPNFVKIDKSVECIAYADDATIMVRGKNFEEVIMRSDEVLERVRVWAAANQLSLNENKTVRMAFSFRSIEFEQEENTRFLGICVNPPFLKFDDHANCVGSRISRSIFVLRQLATAVTPEILRSAYFALIHCHITYCILAWGNSPASEYIFKMQRRAVRVLGRIGFRDDCKHTFMDLQVLTLPCEYILACIMYANTQKHTLDTNSNYHDYETRGRHDIRPDFCRLTRTQRGFLQVSVTLFNKLPPDSRNLTNTALKSRLKRFLLAKAYYSIRDFLMCSDVIL